MTDNKKTPSYELFSIEERGEGEKAFWRRAGVTWTNRDNSLNLKLNFILTPEMKLQLRPYQPRREA